MLNPRYDVLNPRYHIKLRIFVASKQYLSLLSSLLGGYHTLQLLFHQLVELGYSMILGELLLWLGDYNKVVMRNGYYLCSFLDFRDSSMK